MMLYSQLFDEYTSKMMWLCNKQEFSQQKKFVISKDITDRTIIKLLYIHDYMREEFKKCSKRP